MNIRLFFSCLFGVLVSNLVGYVSGFATRSSVEMNLPFEIKLNDFIAWNIQKCERCRNNRNV